MRRKKNEPDVPLNESLREDAVDETLERIEELEIDPELGAESLAVGNRTLGQFLGIPDPKLKNQLFEGSNREQNQITERYLNRLDETDSVIDAGKDLAYCLQFGIDYDLKLGPRMQPSLGMAPPTPGLGGGGGGMMMGGGIPQQQGGGAYQQTTHTQTPRRGSQQSNPPAPPQPDGTEE